MHGRLLEHGRWISYMRFGVSLRPAVTKGSSHDLAIRDQHYRDTATFGVDEVGVAGGVIGR